MTNCLAVLLPAGNFVSDNIKYIAASLILALLVLLLAVIAIAAVAGIVSTAAMGQTPIAIAIGIVSIAFFSRIGC